MRLTTLLCALAIGGQAAAAPFVVDEAHTRVWFTVTHLGFSTMPGIFREFEIEFDFDADHPERSMVDVTIDAASLDMFNDKLNEHLQNADFFDVAHHPTIRFVSSKVEMIDDMHANVTGTVTLLGQSRPATLTVTLNKLAPHPMHKRPHVGFDATATIDRSAFGMTYGVPMVGSSVDLTITMEASARE